jgi:hypothetical protein
LQSFGPIFVSVRGLLLINPRAGREERSGERFELDAPGGRLVSALDGEPVVLETPLELGIEPRALRVLVPRAPRR